jgi:hypothetical protein
MEMSDKKRWQGMPRWAKIAIVTAGIVQFTLLGAVHHDLRRRTSDQLNGPKAVWFAISFLNFVGPMSYFLFGRR